MTSRASAMNIFPPKWRIVVSQQGTTSRIQVEGGWDPQAQERMTRALAQAPRRHPESVVLDLSRATSMDDSGIGLVVGLAERRTCRNVRLVIVPGPAEVHRRFPTRPAPPFVGGL